jgi:tetratricopeptide (TPR) repeat protein
LVFVPELAKRSPQRVTLLDRTVPHKTLAIHANYPTAAAWLSFRLHYYYAAISFLSDAIQEHPRDTRAYERRALVYWEIGQRSLASNDFQQALRINPKETRALRNLAWLISTSPNLSPRDAKRAIKLAQRACQLTSWRDADLIATLAAAYAASGDFREAVATQRRVLAILGDPEVVSGRLDLYIAHKTYPATVIPASW